MNSDSRQAWAAASAGCLALVTAMGIGRFVYTPILPFMIEDAGITTAQAGLIASANFLGYLLGALAAAAISLPGGRRRWLITALAASAISTGAMGLFSTFGAFIALRFAGGVASAFVLILASTLVLDQLATLRRAALSAVHFAGVGAGIALSAVLVAALAARGHDSPDQWIASGIVSLAAAGAVAWLSPRERTPAAAATPGAAGKADPMLPRLTLAYGLFGFGYIITATFISAMVRGAPDLRDAEPVVWLAVGLAGIPSVAAWGWVGRRTGEERAFAIACLVEAAGVVLSVLASNAAAVVLGAAMLGGTFIGISALGLVAARRLASGDPRRALAVMTAAFGLGQVIGPSFAGFAYELGDSFVVPSLAAAAALVLAAALVAVPRFRHAPGR